MSAKDIIAVGRLSSSAPVMAKGAWWFAVLLFPAVVSGQPWEFESPIAVSPEASEGIFHHLDASGRRHVASHHGSIVVVWEDNSEGSPAVYAAIMPVAGLDFTRVRISGRGEAFEPVVTSVGEDAFIIGWEEDGAVWTRLLRGTTPGEPLMLAEDAGQLCLETGPSGRDVYAVWSQRRQHYHHIRSGRIALARGVPLLQETRWVDDHHGGADQSHPVAVYHQGLDALLVVWEDRRFRNTVLMSAAGTPAGRFSIPMQVNELGPPRAADYGRGTGVARAAAAAHDDHVVAVWADKRHFRFGYDIYAAVARYSGRFGDNGLVQDGFAEGFEQWHASISSGGGRLAVAWDDDRDGTSDVWLSWQTPSGWSDDLAVPGAAGPGNDSHPALALDRAGELHLVWTTRAAPDAPTRLWYLHGRLRAGASTP